MRNMFDYINYIESPKKPDELHKDFINEFILFRKENNLTQELMSLYSGVCRTKIARIENESHSPSIKSIIDILGPLGYTIKIEKIKKKS